MIAELRATEFPWTADVTYLNHASIGPLPERTRRAIEEFNRRRAEPFRLPDRDIVRMLAESRRLAARLIGAAPEEIGLTVNTGFGLSIAARALPLAPGDIVLSSEREFPANVYPWMRLREIGVTLELAPTTPEGWPDEPYLLERIHDPRVRVLAISLTQFSNGYTVDLARLSAATRATDTFLVVDAIQAIGHVPVDVGRTPVDVLACGAQKWLLSPWGSGFMYVRRELIEPLHPVVTGWTAYEGTDDFSNLTDYNDTFRANARRFELITLPYQDFAGMNASLALILSTGVERIRDHLRCLHEPIVAWATQRGVPIRSPQDEHRSGILCLSPTDAPRLYRALKHAKVICSLREGALRLSPHLYNTPEEMQHVIEVLDNHL